MVLQHEAGHLVHSRPHCCELDQDIGAVASVGNHPPHPADVTLQARQPVQQGTGLLRRADVLVWVLLVNHAG